MKVPRLIEVSILVLGLLLLSETTAPAGDALYWTHGGDIYAMDLPDGDPGVLLHVSPDGSGDRPMWLRAYQEKLYWGSYASGMISRVDLDGQNPVPLVDQGDNAYIRNIEFFQGKMYWASEGRGKIFRADPDGGNVEEVIGTYTGSDAGIMDFEIHDGRFWWTSYNSYDISRCALDGSQYERVSLADSRRAFWIEFHDGEMYIGDIGPARIRRYSLDGQTYEELVSLGRETLGGEVFKDRLYFNILRTGGPHYIYSTDLEGDDLRIEHAGPSWQFTVVPEPSVMAVLSIGSLALTRRRRRRARKRGLGGAARAPSTARAQAHVLLCVER
ncbi:hypothetical protein LCGC14_1880890 [marine sediment metagenome]|uniref:PEP-CTERM protein-sorting domain-containing protein n=1 Tax=marine sediment metagenome TaxID=412755 RepID=A0A0F9J0R9_9ZZZZ